MDEEAAKLRDMQAQVEKELVGSTTSGNHLDPSNPLNNPDIDARSIYVGNVDYSATPEELQSHFQSCGVINRITILCDRWTGHPKGFAYIEFADPAHVANATALNESLFKNRIIKVASKRTNLPAFMRGVRGGPSGATSGGRGGGRGFRRGAGFRGSRSRRAHFTPY